MLNNNGNWNIITNKSYKFIRLVSTCDKKTYINYLIITSKGYSKLCIKIIKTKDEKDIIKIYDRIGDVIYFGDLNKIIKLDCQYFGMDCLLLEDNDYNINTRIYK